MSLDGDSEPRGETRRRSDARLRTPVLIIIFNRPDTTRRVFAEIAKARPATLLIAADGPRVDRAEDPDRCAAARRIVEQVDWDCDVRKHYSDVNLGCGRGPATAITWAFGQVQEAIVVEDDCLPHPTFFRFCDELLERYREREEVMHICGNSLRWFSDDDIQSAERAGTTGRFSYWFSWHNVCGGGWATWRRAWRHFDLEVKLWPELSRTSWLLDVVGDRRAVGHWRHAFEKAYVGSGHVDNWDYQWTFACWARRGLSIVPDTTLVSNIGFREDATHLRSPNHRHANLPTVGASFPLRHPPDLTRDAEADRFIIRQVIARRWSHTYETGQGRKGRRRKASLQ